MKRTWILLLAISVVVAVSAQGVAVAKGPHVETLGNNLSVPVTFAEGYGLTGQPVEQATGLRNGADQLIDNFSALEGVYTPVFISGDTDASGVPLWSNWFYEQKTVAAWQANWQSLADDDADVDSCQVSYVDWGDSLLAQTWTTRSKIRVEVRLYRANAEQLGGYAMNHLSGTGISEVWGAADTSPVGDPAGEPLWQGRSYVPGYGTVYSSCAHIRIYRVVDGEPVAPAVVDERISAECNVGGTIIYGYNWDPRSLNLAAGEYRVEFDLEPSVTLGGVTVYRNTHINSLNAADTASEWPYAPALSADGYSTWVDVTLVSRKK